MRTPDAERARAYRARKRAAGYRMVKGRWTTEPLVQREPKHPDAPHGLRAYWRGCKCDICRAEWSAYNLARYHARKATR